MSIGNARGADAVDKEHLLTILRPKLINSDRAILGDLALQSYSEPRVGTLTGVSTSRAPGNWSGW